MYNDFDYMMLSSARRNCQVDDEMSLSGSYFLSVQCFIQTLGENELIIYGTATEV